MSLWKSITKKLGNMSTAATPKKAKPDKQPNRNSASGAGGAVAAPIIAPLDIPDDNETKASMKIINAVTGKREVMRCIQGNTVYNMACVDVPGYNAPDKKVAVAAAAAATTPKTPAALKKSASTLTTKPLKPLSVNGGPQQSDLEVDEYLGILKSMMYLTDTRMTSRVNLNSEEGELC